MRKILLILVVAIGVLGVILSLVMLVSAFRFGEWGRVLLYFITLLISAELTAVCFARLFGRKKD